MDDQAMKRAEKTIQNPVHTEEDLRKLRLRITLRSAAVFLLAGVIYIAGFRIFGHGVPCLFRRVTGLLCPGCGMSRALGAISRGNIRQALEYNVLSVTLLPVILLYLFSRAVRYVKTGYDAFRIPERLFLLVCISICALYFLMRNDLL